MMLALIRKSDPFRAGYSIGSNHDPVYTVNLMVNKYKKLLIRVMNTSLILCNLLLMCGLIKQSIWLYFFILATYTFATIYTISLSS